MVGLLQATCVKAAMLQMVSKQCALQVIRTESELPKLLSCGAFAEFAPRGPVRASANSSGTSTNTMVVTESYKATSAFRCRDVEQM
jgi:hypothetical protein